MTIDDPYRIGDARCQRCDLWFEDLAVAIARTGGWCPRCDAPARVAT